MNKILHMLFSPQGRMRRRDFWFCTAGLWLVYISAIALASFLTFDIVAPGRARLIMALALLPVFLWSAAALLVKRMHDRGFPALTAVMLLRPITGWARGMAECCSDGTPGPNAYGPSPKKRIDPADNF